MNPVAFTVFGIEIRWYGILMASGMFIASMLMLHFSRKRGYKDDTVFDFLLAVLPSGIVGARLYYVIFKWDYYSQNLRAILNIREGGLAIHGGVIGGVFAGYIFCRLKKISFAEIMDMVAPGLILGQAIGRWGNYANSEAHGGPTNLPWAIEVEGVMVHPTFLYESIWNLLVFIFLIRRYNKKGFDGEIFLLYGILYSIGRFFIEGLRTDSLMIGGLRTAQLVSIVTIVVFGGIWARETYKNKRS